MHLRHQAYTLYYRHILVFLHVFAFSMLLRCMLKFKRLACGIEDVTQYNTHLLLFYQIAINNKLLIYFCHDILLVFDCPTSS